MAKIETYVVDSVPTVNDKVIGTDADASNRTKNYRISDILGLATAKTSYATIPSGTSGTWVLPKASWNGEDYIKPMFIDASTLQETPLPWGFDIFPDPNQINVFIGSGSLPNDYYVLI